MSINKICFFFYIILIFIAEKSKGNLSRHQRQRAKKRLMKKLEKQEKLQAKKIKNVPVSKNPEVS